MSVRKAIVIFCDHPGCGALLGEHQPEVELIKSRAHYRAVKARAVRFGDQDAAAAAEVGLRAARIAQAIRVANAGLPPLPPEITAALSALLSSGDKGQSPNLCRAHRGGAA